ncbi:MAG: nucleotidyltransferase domain-containing protein [Leptolyngbyaceae cyanobacterium SM2_5_2]|nr:nucleotidyltransferase domain-containing protein [Leptolyngbyaceae cyanobacterium SM2_5_2]
MAVVEPDLELNLQETLATCKQILVAHYADRLRSLILYGSAARDTLALESDLDLLVLLTPPINYFQELRTIVELLYPLQMTATYWLSAKPASQDEFEQGVSQLYRNIQREGILL